MTSGSAGAFLIDSSQDRSNSSSHANVSLYVYA